MEAGKLVDRSVEACVQACLSATDDGEVLKQVSAAAGVVGQALSDLLQHVRHYASCGEPIGRYDQATDTIMTVTESIFTSMGDAGELRGRGGGEWGEEEVKRALEDGIRRGGEKKRGGRRGKERNYFD